MTARVLWYLVIGLLFWPLAGLPARNLGGGDGALLFAGVALGLCLIPGALTLTWGEWVLRNDPAQGPLLVLGSSGGRMFAVLLAALVLHLAVVPFRGQNAFLLWVLAAYLYTLVVEVVLLIRGAASTAPTPGTLDVRRSDEE